MSDYYELHPDHPNQKFLDEIVNSLNKGAVIAYPTDSGYALGAKFGNLKAIERMIKIRELEPQHNFSLMCRDISEVSDYAKVNNITFRFLNRCLPGEYTFILNAAQIIPKKLQKPSKKTIGIRISPHEIVHVLTSAMEDPLFSTTLIMPGETAPLIYPDDVVDAVTEHVDIIIDGSYCGFEPTTVVDLTTDSPIILREGNGSLAPLGF